MPDKMLNAAWWSKNKAITLLDSGDTVKKALQKWDAYKSDNRTWADESVKKCRDTLAAVKKTSGDLQRKANNTLHKQTITYLVKYQQLCEQVDKKLVTVLENSKTLHDSFKKAMVPNGQRFPKNMQSMLAGGLGWCIAEVRFMEEWNKTKTAAPGLIDRLSKSVKDGKLRTQLATLAKAKNFNDKAWATATKQISDYLLKWMDAATGKAAFEQYTLKMTMKVLAAV